MITNFTMVNESDLLITNALYFCGKFQVAFEKKHTENNVSCYGHQTRQQIGTVSMMHSKAEKIFKQKMDGNWDVSKLEYAEQFFLSLLCSVDNLGVAVIASDWTFTVLLIGSDESRMALDGLGAFKESPFSTNTRTQLLRAFDVDFTRNRKCKSLISRSKRILCRMDCCCWPNRSNIDVIRWKNICPQSVVYSIDEFLEYGDREGVFIDGQPISDSQLYRVGHEKDRHQQWGGRIRGERCFVSRFPVSNSSSDSRWAVV